MKTLLFFTCMLTALYGNAQVTNQHLFDTIPFIPDHYARKTAAFRQEHVVTGKIIFLGNSITEGGRWRDLTGDQTVINRGIGGDITFGVLKRLDDITTRKPSKLFILIGINDIGKDIPDAVIADNCRKIIERVKTESPETVIYLQSILPLNPDYPKFPQHYDKVERVTATNILLRNVAERTGVHFVNLYPLFLDDHQQLDRNFTNDGLHLNQRAYERWVDFLKKIKALN